MDATARNTSRLKIPEAWTFQSVEVAQGFDSHVREQLPWYDLATEAVGHIVRHYLPRNGIVYDVGCSTGNIGRCLKDTIERQNAELVGIEQSREMADKYDGPGRLVVSDAETFDYNPFDVAVLFLVLQFLSVESRQALLKVLRSRVKLGGAIVVVDKFAPGDGYFGSVVRRMTMSYKLLTGTTAEEIVAKELSLAGAQRPLDQAELPGARQFFCLGEFAGYVIEADK